MSKNVAVFVDVANIFYAAKAAGVDIDYVTLLKSASAGRDLVRAYAYTGLDPENENQRQFHSFLSRSGYKVISKDIRKYGDGRIKANLDIELVVDMMRMATHLDIAVVISGDGDFAPAIRAVQQMGVRVEVISFRGNTSSDLIDVADVFIDITQVARVEKGGRSGRRVAAEGDLSMTEVPDKETEGAARRRRTPRRTERGVVTIAPVADADDGAAGGEPDDLPGNIIVLPGERLSKVGTEDEADSTPAEVDTTAAEQGQGQGQEGESEAEAENRRRRRRRGGRGRGRGRREEGQPMEAVPAAAQPSASPAIAATADVPDDEEEFLDEVPVAIPQHSTFGSVWDSQMGVPSASLSTTPLAEDEEDLDEPEIPEYLLAERRQQQQRNRGGRGGSGNRGGGGRAGAYRTALDRERFGRSGVSSFGGAGAAAGSMGSNMSRPPERRGRDPRPQAPGRGNRPPARDVQHQARPPQAAPRPSQDAEPWSEVPEEVQALLRAELARRSGRPDGGSPRPAEDATLTEATATEATATQGPGASEAEGAAPSKRSTRTPRSRSTAQAAAPDAPEGTAGDASTDGNEAEATPVARPRATRARKPRVTEAPATDATGADPGTEAEEPAPAPKRRTTRKPAASAAKEASGEEAPSDETAAAAPKPRKRTTRRPAATSDASDASGEGESTTDA